MINHIKPILIGYAVNTVIVKALKLVLFIILMYFREKLGKEI